MYFDHTPNQGKDLAIDAGGRRFLRIPLRTHFVKIGEDYARLAARYAAPRVAPGDVLCISEKIIALFVHRTPAGPGAGTPHKMQLVIMECGLPRVLLAALCSALTRPFGWHGVFYRLCGHEVGSIDGLIDYDISFAEYYHYAILAPEDCRQVCDQLEEQLGVPCAIVDACDRNVEVLGTSHDMPYPIRQLKEMLRDNPAGQGSQQTPLIVVRPA